MADDLTEDLRLTRAEFVEVVEMRRDVKYIRERIDELFRTRRDMLRDLVEHSNRIAALEARFWVFAFLVPVLAGLVSMLLGKLL